jgi:hypothetical protein
MQIGATPRTERATRGVAVAEALPAQAEAVATLAAASTV